MVYFFLTMSLYFFDEFEEAVHISLCSNHICSCSFRFLGVSYGKDVKYMQTSACGYYNVSCDFMFAFNY